MSYQQRHIEFKQHVNFNDWQVKVYTIVKSGHFDNDTFYQAAIEELPNWLSMKNSFDASHAKHAFLILHIGTEGIFSIINWWVGGNMLNTHIFFSEHGSTAFKLISGDGLAPCIWELEVIEHERQAWIKHILKKEKSDYTSYLTEIFTMWL